MLLEDVAWEGMSGISARLKLAPPRRMPKSRMCFAMPHVTMLAGSAPVILQ